MDLKLALLKTKNIHTSAARYALKVFFLYNSFRPRHYHSHVLRRGTIFESSLQVAQSTLDFFHDLWVESAGPYLLYFVEYDLLGRQLKLLPVRLKKAFGRRPSL